MNFVTAAVNEIMKCFDECRMNGKYFTQALLNFQAVYTLTSIMPVLMPIEIKISLHRLQFTGVIFSNTYHLSQADVSTPYMQWQLWTTGSQWDINITITVWLEAHEQGFTCQVTGFIYISITLAGQYSRSPWMVYNSTSTLESHQLPDWPTSIDAPLYTWQPSSAGYYFKHQPWFECRRGKID